MTETRRSLTTDAWSAMDADLLCRVRRTSIIVGIIIGIPFATYFGLMAGVAWLAGIAWSLVNMAMTATLIRRLLSDRRDKVAIVRVLTIKFPVLYVTGMLLVAVLHLPVAWLVAGFTWPLFVAVMKALGRLYLRLDETATDC